MSTIISTHRLFLLVAATAAFTTLAAFAADPAASPAPCDVPVAASGNDTSAQTRTPEQPPEKVRVVHNGQTICVSSQAAQAHAKHGDATAGPCQPGDKQGS